MEATKDVTVKGVTYQIGRFSALNGSWILAQLLTKMLPAIIEKAFAQQGAALATGRASLTEEEFANIQGHALAVVSRYETGHPLPLPVFLRPTTFAVKDLQFDIVAVMSLTVHALLFNLMPFFEDGGLLGILETSGLLDLAPTLSSRLTSTASPSDQSPPTSGDTKN